VSAQSEAPAGAQQTSRIFRHAVLPALNIVYAREEPPQSYAKSIFLVGPTPRSDEVPSWRPEALRLLRATGYDGVVFVPEDRPNAVGSRRMKDNYDGQIDWEERCLNLADVILAWVPRNLQTMPALTTNVEWGRWQASGKIVLGSPSDAVKNSYLESNARSLQVSLSTTLEHTVEHAIELLGDGSNRQCGEREVPLYVWRTTSFQQWYASLVQAGNTLEHAKVEWTFRVGPARRYVLFWALRVEIHIAAEGRSKTNEVVIGRPDISTIMLYQRATDINDSVVILIREFRSPASNTEGFVYELAGGSSFNAADDPLVLAAHECEEETGLRVDPGRFRQHGVRQVVATLSAHRAHLFSVELTDAEVGLLRADTGNPHGSVSDTERTHVEVVTLGAIREQQLVDWSMIGMITDTLLSGNQSTATTTKGKVAV